jgi:positive regulator of sigma E activity
MDVLCEWTQLVILLVVEVVAVAVGEEDMVVVVDAVVGLVDAVVVVEVIVVSCLHYIRHLR